MTDIAGNIRLGTRGSALALAQSEWVARELLARRPELGVELVVIRTAADRAPHLPLSAIGDKALWVADLEQQLRTGEIDLAVHSLKDVPAILAPGLCIGAVPERECALDALVMPAGSHLTDPRLADPVGVVASSGEVQAALSALLPIGARVGTSSDRRKGQLLLWRPDLNITPVRGNVDTRLRKLDSGEWDALVLAAAGLRRLDRSERISALFPARMMVPAAGQGALALEIREDDRRMQELLSDLNHGPTEAAVTAERAFVRAVAGGCSIPLGVHAKDSQRGLELRVRAVAPQPAPGAPPSLEDMEIAEIPKNEPYKNLDWAVSLGERLAERFLENGGRAFMDVVLSAER